nr:TfoX/Sxy family protein [Arthrobacter sp. 147(2020)]
MRTFPSGCATIRRSNGWAGHPGRRSLDRIRHSSHIQRASVTEGAAVINTSSSREYLSVRLRDLFASYPDVREIRMFGGISFMVNDRMAVAADRAGDLLVRTNPTDYDDLLRRGAVPALMGQDKPMGRGWLTVPRHQLDDDAELAYWVKVGINSGEPAKCKPVSAHDH